MSRPGAPGRADRREAGGDGRVGPNRTGRPRPYAYPDLRPPEEGRALALTTARPVIEETRPDDDVRGELRPEYPGQAAE
ncbi:hexameric tyrosine-coordinated heme protein [Streptomyces sp. NPDC048277]|uniref:hexameric tyrosine-coordinated heme protein n=1 Tax=Streptomyces sp. NPDC048277 TaxID=3155027 RepID=UPI0033C429CA